MTHAELVERGARWLRAQGCNLVLSEFVAYTRYGEIPDVLGWRGGVSVLLEAKASRSDFLADRKKVFRVNPEFGMGDWRIFIAPAGLIDAKDLPKGWSLLEVKGRTCTLAGGPLRTYELQSYGVTRKTRKVVAWHDVPPFTAHKPSEVSTLLSALRRLQLHLGDAEYHRLIHLTFAEKTHGSQSAPQPA
ncbi:MAG TPA: hypothetical protein VGD46_15520 [Rhizobacter sp.]